jgi:hypothetical protein
LPFSVLLILRFQLSNAAWVGNLDGQQVGSPLEMRPDTGKTLSRKTGVIPGDWTRREGDWGSRRSLQGQRLPSAASVEAVLPALLITIYHSHFQVPAWFMVVFTSSDLIFVDCCTGDTAETQCVGAS